MATGYHVSLVCPNCANIIELDLRLEDGLAVGETVQFRKCSAFHHVETTCTSCRSGVPLAELKILAVRLPKCT